jgi:hypothetical protein
MKCPSFAMVVSAVALFVALGGTGYAATSGSHGLFLAQASGHHKIHNTKFPKIKLVRGPVGPRGPAGPQGPSGQAGATGQQGPAGTARAYAYVQPHLTPCAGCGELEAGAESAPVVAPTRSLNVALGSYNPTDSTWCFTLGAGINPATTTVAVSPVGVGPFTKPGLPRFEEIGALWVPSAGGCMGDDVEVRTVGYEIQNGKLVAVPNDEIAFSLVVP